MAGAGLALGAAELAGLWAPARAQSAAEPLTTERLRDGVIRIGGAGGNVVAAGGPNGVAVVDSGAPGHGQALRRLIDDAFGGAPIEALLNTHWHLAHTGGNERLADASTAIVAHENTRLWMSTELYVEWQERTYAPRPEGALPTETFFSSDPQPIERRAGDERLVYGHLKGAHTDGDIYVYLPEHNVIAAGGAVTVGSYPLLDYITGGWIGGAVEAAENLMRICDADTLIVPQSGPAQTRAHLEAQREMLSTVRERIEELAVQGKGVEDMLAAGITDDFDADWEGDREQFLRNVYKGLWWSDMRGIVA